MIIVSKHQPFKKVMYGSSLAKKENNLRALKLPCLLWVSEIFLKWYKRKLSLSQKKNNINQLTRLRT